MLAADVACLCGANGFLALPERLASDAASRLADQGSLGWRRQMVEVQAAFIVAVLIEAAKCESLLHEAPMSGRFAPDIEQISETVSEDVARLKHNGISHESRHCDRG